MMKRLLFVVILALLSFTAAVAQGGHEYAPLKEETINYKDWTFKNAKDDAPLNLRRWAQGKKLVLVAYFAPWCGNWKMEAPVVARLHDKYKAHGFDVVAVNNYGTADERVACFGEQGAPYTVVVESDARTDRDKTAHYSYRQLTGDTRKWGSPYNIFLVPSKLNKEGDILTEKAWVVGGELIEQDVEQFIRAQLGLGAETKNAAVEKKP